MCCCLEREGESPLTKQRARRRFAKTRPRKDSTTVALYFSFQRKREKERESFLWFALFSLDARARAKKTPRALFSAPSRVRNESVYKS